MSVRLRLALTVLLTGLATAIGVVLTMALALERVERESTFARANAFAQRVARQHGDLIGLQRREPGQVDDFLRSLVLFEPGSQLYLLDAEGRIRARSGTTPLDPGHRVDVEPVRLAARLGGGGRASADGAAYVMGDDPEHRERDAVVAAHALHEAVIRPTSEPAGYLYVVCRPPGSSRSRLAELSRQLSGPVLAPVLAVVLMATLLAGWIIGAVTRPLATLSREVDAVAQAGFEGALPLLQAQALAPAGDEIGRLRSAFAQLLQRLREQWARLRHLDAFRRESVSNLSHDLRSPLTAAMASLETLLARWPEHGRDEADRRLVELALRNAHSAARLVHSLGDLAVLDEAEYRLRLMRLDLVEVLDDIGARFADRARAVGVQLSVEGGLEGGVEGGGGEALPAEIDIELFERALANLLDNALRHTPPGGRITLAASAADGWVQVRVSDTGSGIAASEQQGLFDRFRQGPDAAAGERSRGSHGLGLAIVRRIIELHRGCVQLHSTPGQGTTVVLQWPLADNPPGAQQ